MVTRPGLVRCLYCRWLPFVAARYQPSASINLITSRIFILVRLIAEDRGRIGSYCITNWETMFMPGRVVRFDLWAWSPYNFRFNPFNVGYTSAYTAAFSAYWACSTGFGSYVRLTRTARATASAVEA